MDRYRKGVAKHPDFYILLQVSNTNKGLMEWLVSLFGGYVRTIEPDYKLIIPRIKTLYVWSVSCRKATTIIERMAPYLKVKRRQAELVSEFSKFARARVLFATRNSVEVAKAVDILLKVRAMNSKNKRE